MNWKRYLAVALIAILLVGITGYVFRKQIILYMVATVARDATVVEPNRAITWQKGPETADKPSGERPPNVILILADDLGINDISHFGGGVAGGTVPTTNIDALARSGAVFPKAYSGTAACAPSRAMLMTGRYGTRTGFEFTPTPDGMTRILPLFYNDGTRPHELIATKHADEAQVPFAQQGLPASEVTVAEVLKGAGYHTMHIGKE